MMIVLSEISFIISLYAIIIRYINHRLYIEVSKLNKIIIIICVFLIIHFLMGYVLLISSKLHKFMMKDENESIKADFMLSYFIISIYLLILLLYPEQIRKYEITGLLGVGICYILNLKILFKTMFNARFVKFNDDDKGSFFNVTVLAMLILVLIIINLFLGVCLVNNLGVAGYSNNPTYFDLFYYTIVTFTTIGFGDIIPLTSAAKLMTIIISITSILCLTIFLSSIYSLNDRR